MGFSCRISSKYQYKYNITNGYLKIQNIKGDVLIYTSGNIKKKKKMPNGDLENIFPL